MALKTSRPDYDPPTAAVDEPNTFQVTHTVVVAEIGFDPNSDHTADEAAMLAIQNHARQYAYHNAVIDQPLQYAFPAEDKGVTQNITITFTR